MRALLAAAAIAAACCAAGSATAAGNGAGPPNVDARAWLVMNPVTGEVLAEHDARYQVPIASITKLMTMIVVLEHLKLTDVVHVDPRAAAVGQESIYLRAGQELTVADLVKGSMIQSANDAADALALATAPSYPAFAAMMNAKAKQLGLTDSHFVRPDGLDAPGEYSSARDVTRLALAAMRLAPVRQAVDEVTATIADGQTLHTWDDLLGVFPGVFGVKTGHTDGARWGQVSAVRGGGTTIYATILGSPSRARRNADLEKLLAYGIAQYRRVDPVVLGKSYAMVKLPYGRKPLPLVARGQLHAVVRVGEPLTERVFATSVASLPVRQGQVLGHVQVWSRGKLLGERPLVASRAVAKPSLLGRAGWYAGRTVDNVVGIFTP
ncbi:MAG TPA: D-alanyl-D-alanine carboxypeptidase family protein [Gaiellaceae bacterium]|jgi:D-alanyl-D-alanine carboxypeptidase (penicillin-binding protein 5/6)|nr:D-alanyl-D-alanine carboxypeptidase family protein [Gaiellaceae bacterium]